MAPLKALLSFISIPPDRIYRFTIGWISERQHLPTAKNIFLSTAKPGPAESIKYQGPGHGIWDLGGLPKQPGPESAGNGMCALNRPPEQPKREDPKSKPLISFDLALI